MYIYIYISLYIYIDITLSTEKEGVRVRENKEQRPILYLQEMAGHCNAAGEHEGDPGGFYFVCVMTYHSEFVFAKRYGFGCNLFRPPTKVAPNTVPFSVSVLAVVTRKGQQSP